VCSKWLRDLRLWQDDDRDRSDAPDGGSPTLPSRKIDQPTHDSAGCRSTASANAGRAQTRACGQRRSQCAWSGVARDLHRTPRPAAPDAERIGALVDFAGTPKGKRALSIVKNDGYGAMAYRLLSPRSIAWPTG
jgi:hypothetical protein